MTHLLGLMLLILPAEPWPVDYVDAVEVNTVMNHDGQRRFTQTLWLELAGPNSIVDWRFYYPPHLPVGHWALFEDKGQPRAVYSVEPRLLYSETYYDPEVEHRKSMPLLWRRGLTGSPK